MSALVDLPKLLAECARNQMPDYFQFYSGVQQMLDSAVPPRTLCETFAAELRRADNAIRMYAGRSERGESFSQEEILLTKLALHKMKLLIGCANRFPRPMNEFIMKMAGTS